ncbi:MAG TPA: hypothetical protein P5528_03630 [Steroidobacteraceae bacterium]|nr:hypothetical protein [Steroidobacteraceae bacterium]HRX88514.1 hypothetical protein [Steroidobacteraceae bacterium]
MRYALTAARLLFGLAYLVFGLNSYLHILPMGEARNPPFIAMMVDSGYFHLVKGTQIVGGALLVLNQFVVLALVLLTAMTVNIVVFYLTMYRAEYEVAAVFGALNVLLLWAYRRPLAALFQRRAPL